MRVGKVYEEERRIPMEDLGKISKGYKYVKATPYSLV